VLIGEKHTLTIQLVVVLVATPEGALQQIDPQIPFPHAQTGFLKAAPNYILPLVHLHFPLYTRPHMRTGTVLAHTRRCAQSSCESTTTNVSQRLSFRYCSCQLCPVIPPPSVTLLACYAVPQRR